MNISAQAGHGRLMEYDDGEDDGGLRWKGRRLTTEPHSLLCE